MAVYFPSRLWKRRRTYNISDRQSLVILETLQNDKLQVSDRSTDNNLIADIPSVQLPLANADAFTFGSEKPLTEVTEITCYK